MIIACLRYLPIPPLLILQVGHALMEEPRGISWNLALGLLVVHPVGAAYHTLLGRSRCCRWFG